MTRRTGRIQVAWLRRITLLTLLPLALVLGAQAMAQQTGGSSTSNNPHNYPVANVTTPRDVVLEGNRVELIFTLTGMNEQFHTIRFEIFLDSLSDSELGSPANISWSGGNGRQYAFIYNSQGAGVDPNATSHTFRSSVRIFDDNEVEDVEQFRVRLIPKGGDLVVAGDSSEVTFTVVDFRCERPMRTSSSHDTTCEVPSTWSYIPDGLEKGDRFRLVFVTTTKRRPDSTDIREYDYFIHDTLFAEHASSSDLYNYVLTFKVFGSSAKVWARDYLRMWDHTANWYTDEPNQDETKNIGSYWLGSDLRVAKDYHTLLVGNWENEASPYGESGSPLADSLKHDPIVTGTYWLGQGLRTHNVGPLGSFVTNIHAGLLDHATVEATQDSEEAGKPASRNKSWQFYGISPIFVVGD